MHCAILFASVLVPAAQSVALLCAENILTVVLTGGPCGGKTSSLNMMTKKFTEMGYEVLA